MSIDFFFKLNKTQVTAFSCDPLFSPLGPKIGSNLRLDTFVSEGKKGYLQISHVYDKK